MSNATIEFTAIRNLVSGVTSGDTIQLDVSLTAFDLSPDINKKTSRPMDGSAEESSLFYIGSNISVSMLESGIVTLPSTATTPLTTEYVEMFLHSVAASEEFTITDLDNSDAALDVQLSGAWSRQRRSSAFVNEFAYNFKLRTI